jgi:3-mercaptopyruvate sulfurtransferase SseA
MENQELWKVEDFGHDNVKVFDNGEETFDRFTVYIHDPAAGDYDVYLMSHNANMPNGCCQYVDYVTDIDERGLRQKHIPHGVYFKIKQIILERNPTKGAVKLCIKSQ